MGQARRRGSFEERKAQAIERDRLEMERRLQRQRERQAYREMERAAVLVNSSPAPLHAAVHPRTHVSARARIRAIELIALSLGYVP